jgi:hypothetical protein
MYSTSEKKAYGTGESNEAAWFSVEKIAELAPKKQEKLGWT